MIELKYDNQDIFGESPNTCSAVSTRGDINTSSGISCVDCGSKICVYEFHEKTVIANDGEQVEVYSCCSCALAREKSMLMGAEFGAWLEEDLLPKVDKAVTMTDKELTADIMDILRQNIYICIHEFWDEHKVKRNVLNPCVEVRLNKAAKDKPVSVLVHMLCPNWLGEKFPSGTWQMVHNGQVEFNEEQRAEIGKSKGLKREEIDIEQRELKKKWEREEAAIERKDERKWRDRYGVDAVEALLEKHEVDYCVRCGDRLVDAGEDTCEDCLHAGWTVNKTP